MERANGLLAGYDVPRRVDGKGAASVWVDQFWQVEVLTGPDGRVESIASRPSDSLYHRTLGRLLPPLR